MTSPELPPSDEHRRLRASLGVWVLGALDGRERREVEAHLASCEDCATEEAELSPLPGLLSRVSEEEATDDSRSNPLVGTP